MVDVVTMGELLIDFVSTESGMSLEEAPAFKKAPGGAPANVAVGLARLGVKSGFIGMVGDDDFGHFLGKLLAKVGVDTSLLRYTKEARTMLAFVSLRADGERDFMFYRHPSADMLHAPGDIDPEYIRSAKIFHHGSISLISEPARSATQRAVEIGQEAGLMISYDPNLRLNLWPSEEKARQGILSVWDQADLIKVSEEEVYFLSGEKDILAGVRRLWGTQLRLVIVTLGERGCIYITRDFNGQVPGFQVEVVDTTGAGDGFVAGLLAGILKRPNAWMDETAIREICIFSNAVGALTTIQRGAIPALPSREAVESFLRKNMQA